MITFQNNEKRLERIAVHARGEILDIGFAQFPNEYLFGNVIGFDLNKPKTLPFNYSMAVKGDVKDIKKKFKKATFDTIIASEVIEHIDNHKKFFEDCNFLLKKGGRLILSTPTPYYYRTLIGNLFLMDGTINNREHCSVYIPRILNAVADEAGFDLMKVEPATSFYVPFLTYQMIYVYYKRRYDAD